MMTTTAPHKSETRMRLTDLAIKNLTVPEKGQKTYWDDGLGMRVSQGGTKSFVVMYGQKRRLHTLGRYPAMSLKSARKAFYAFKSASHPPPAPTTLSEAISAYLTACESKNRPSTVAFYRHFLSQVARNKVSDVRPEDIDHSSPHAVTTWKVFLNWCVKRGILERNPMAYATVSHTARDRVLSDAELKALWLYDRPPYSDYVKLFILTGQRRGQFNDFTVVDETLVFPARVMKGKREHVIPITPLMASVLERLEPFNGWSKSKARMDRETGVSGYVIHDLRRTFATNCARLGVPLHVAEQIMDHRTTVSGIVAVYNRWNYLPEMRDALVRYENHIREISA